MLQPQFHTGASLWPTQANKSIKNKTSYFYMVILVDLYAFHRVRFLLIHLVIKFKVFFMQSSKDELRSLTVWGKKLPCSPEVQPGTL